jgi:hypothetical protein
LFNHPYFKVILPSRIYSGSNSVSTLSVCYALPISCWKEEVIIFLYINARSDSTEGFTSFFSLVASLSTYSPLVRTHFFRTTGYRVCFFVAVFLFFCGRPAKWKHLESAKCLTMFALHVLYLGDFCRSVLC